MAVLVNEDGEVLEFVDEAERSAFIDARRAWAAFKFKLLETIAADPRLVGTNDETGKRKKGRPPCVNVMLTFSRFVTVDARSLKPGTCFASITTLMAYSGAKKATIRDAVRLLEANGYLVRTGKKTKEGCPYYNVANPHAERVDAHVQAALEHYRTERAEQRALERRDAKRPLLHRAAVGAVNDPTISACGYGDGTHVGALNEPNYIRATLEGLGSEEEAPNGVPARYGDEPVTDPDEPIAVPSTDSEIAAVIQNLFEVGVPAAAMPMMRARLLAGELTRAIVEEQIRLGEREAA